MQAFLNSRFAVMATTMSLICFVGNVLWAQSRQESVSPPQAITDNLLLEGRFAQFDYNMTRAQMLDMLDIDQAPEETAIGSPLCDAFEYTHDGWRYFLNIWDLGSGYATSRASVGQSIPCSTPWCLTSVGFVKSKANFCHSDRYYMELNINGEEHIEIGMTRQDVLAVLGPASYSDRDGSPYPIADSFTYDLGGELRYLHVWYRNGRVSSFSTGHRFPGGRLIFPALPGFADQNFGESPDFGSLLQNMGERPESGDH